MANILLYDFSNAASYPGSGTTVTDLTGNSNGTMVNGPEYGTGECGNNYLEFDGSNDYLVTNSDLNPYLNPANTSTVISLFTWVYPIENGVIVSEHESAESLDEGWHDSQIEMVSGTMCFSVWPYDFGIAKITSSISTPFNQWHYVGLTYDGTVLKAYVNGQLAGTSTYVRSTPYNQGSSAPLRYALGYGTGTNMAVNGAGNFARMRIGTFEVYNNALNESEVLSNYNNSSTLWLCLSQKNYGHNKLTNRGDRFVVASKRLFKNIFYRTSGSGHYDHES